MDISLSIRFDDSNDIADLPDQAKLIEDLGFSTIWYPDHLVTFEQYSPQWPYPYTADGTPTFGTSLPWFDAHVVLTAIAAHTSRVRLGGAVMVLPQRSPLRTAKEGATIDHLSKGRYNLGVGVGWSGDEYAALGVPFERRGARANEYLDVIKLLWSGEAVTIDGEFVSLKGAVMRPPPYGGSLPPIYVGGESAPALRRAAKHANGWVSGVIGLEELAATIKRLDAACEAIERDPSELQHVWTYMYTDAELLKREMAQAEQLGLHELCLAVRRKHHPGKSTEEIIAEIAQVSGTERAAGA
ncbi:TIGR03619 family F420-dependent LLM class oxidoreductase [Nocardioides immobilis]|uniref:TIGR03619 family F420-dependent LLM class oxidoreductase n=1 Tax=Nocardioides immobilis TaxID=2049295 RepID=A0A417Y0V8_9ACTN|nr:TIGR03619 family F420-dependent LLM class oxidoreductase [Nocardioides immobilis]RHW26288.1 TIGR03619 family F420-dependent LLM class oxidoreductase [Nocardioides immobilis]